MMFLIVRYLLLYSSTSLSVAEEDIKRPDLTDLTFDSTMSPSRLTEDSFDPGSKPGLWKEKVGQAEAGKVVNRMEQPSALF